MQKKLETRIKKLEIELSKMKKAEKDASELAGRYINILESLNDGVFTLNRKGEFVYLTRVCESVFGWSRIELFGSLIKNFVPRGSKKAVDGILKKTVKGERLSHIEVRILTQKTGERVIDLNTSPARDRGKITGLQCVARDITEKKRIEDALKASELQLKKKVKELEKFTNFAVGRELRIVQLKKEVKELKKKIR